MMWTQFSRRARKRARFPAQAFKPPRLTIACSTMSNVGGDSQVEDVIFHNYSVLADDQLVGMTEIDVRALDTRAIAELDPEIIDADRIRRSEAYLSRTRRADLSACYESDLRSGAVALWVWHKPPQPVSPMHC